MGINAVLSAPALSAGLAAKFTDFNFADLNGVGKAFPGMMFTFQGNVYQVVQNRSGGALAVGDCVSLLLNDSTRTGNLTNSSTVAVVVTDDTFDTGLRGDRANPGTIAVTAGVLATTADMQIREIRGNSTAAGASTATVAELDRSLGPTYQAATSSAEAFTGVPDNTWDYGVFCNWEVVKSDLDALVTCLVQGVVVSTSITDDFFGIIQVSGIAQAKVDGTTDLVAGDLLIPDSASGVLSKWVVGAPDANGVTRSNFVCARILLAYTNDASGLRQVQLIPKNVNFVYPIFQ